MKHILQIETILYVADQQAAAAFYTRLFRQEPDLHVPGMTEFRLGPNCKLGLMPNKGIAKILEDKTPHPDTGNGIPRCELYLCVADVQFEYEHALQSGARLISTVSEREWGDKVCYLADPDNHIIAFAQTIS